MGMSRILGCEANVKDTDFESNSQLMEISNFLKIGCEANVKDTDFESNSQLHHTGAFINQRCEANVKDTDFESNSQPHSRQETWCSVVKPMSKILILKAIHN